MLQLNLPVTKYRILTHCPLPTVHCPLHSFLHVSKSNDMGFSGLIGILLLATLCPCYGWRSNHWRVHRPHSINKVYSVDPKISESYIDQTIKPTTMLLNVTYDGGRFTGWSAQNDDQPVNATQLPKQSVRARRRSKEPRGFVRSVEGVLRFHLARIFGDIDPERIIIEGCSRTDKGVHAQSMICQIYCLREDLNTTTDSSIPGKRLPHPRSTYDTSYFVPVPRDCERIMHIMNRMCASDVKIRGIMPTPTKSQGLPFHPTLDCTGKTYEYSISVGPIHDPTSWRRTWHLEHVDHFDMEAVQQACKLLEGTHDFIAFRGAPRGKDDKKRQELENTRCTLHRIELQSESQNGVFPALHSSLIRYTISVKGDRFLYKMMRFIAGVLVAVGTHKLHIKSVASALESGTWDMQETFQCAPPHGLVLKDVHFHETITLDWIN